ncbi:MAG: pyruvate ferredoxin oxidoreductase [Prevotella sp.]|jgi:hypothetical protein
MDYKYIEQLLERYWKCETSLQEEEILRSFFSQDNVPASLMRYKDLFCYEKSEPQEDVLGEDFDAKMLARIDSQRTVKARVIRMPQRLRPLFKAAAIVAIVLTLGNAMQVAFVGQSEQAPATPTSIQKGSSMAAVGDSASIDTAKHAGMATTPQTDVLIK